MLGTHLLIWFKRGFFYGGLLLLGAGELELALPKEILHDLEQVKIVVAQALQMIGGGVCLVIFSMFIKQR